jgi:hypothetical protein
MGRIIFAVLVGIALVAPTPAEAQETRWARQVSGQLNRYSDLLSDKGYRLTQEIMNGSLGDDQSDSFSLELVEGRSYALLGVCDEDCSDLDLRLLDEDGNEIDADVEADDYPVVEVRPRRTARFRVRVIMTTCSTSPCFYGVGVFGK